MLSKNSKRALRRHQAETHMRRRLSEDRNQHRYEVDHRYPRLNKETNELELDPICACYYDLKAMARFKEQPKFDCHCMCCGYQAYYKREEPTLQERKSDLTFKEELDACTREYISRLSTEREDRT